VRPAQTPEEIDTLKVKKAWEVALAPIKGLPMTGIMMYMSGNSLQIFSIMMVFMAFKNPITGLLATGQAFERFDTPGNRSQILQVKLAYIAMQLVALALAVWKVNSMGLLPYVRSYVGLPGRRADCLIGRQDPTGSRGRRSGNHSRRRLWHYRAAWRVGSQTMVYSDTSQPERPLLVHCQYCY